MLSMGVGLGSELLLMSPRTVLVLGSLFPTAMKG